MSIINFNHDSSKLLNWVISGAEKTGYGSMLLIDIDPQDKLATVRTNTPFPRALTVDVSDVEDSADPAFIVFSASVLTGIANKVADGDSISISIDDEDDSTVHISSSTTSLSLSLSNMSDVTPIVEPVKAKETLTTVSAHEVIGALATASGLSPKNSSGYVDLFCDKDNLSVGVHSDRLVSKEIFPSSLTGDESYDMSLDGKSLSALKPLLKSEAIENMKIKQSLGVVSFELPIDVHFSEVKHVSYATPTVIAHREQTADPCDEEANQIATISRTALKSALSPLSSVVGKNGIVTLDTSNNSTVVVKISDSNNSARTVVLDAVIHDSAIIEVPLDGLVSIVRNITTAEVSVGTMSAGGERWCGVSPEHSDDDNPGEDITIAIPVVES